MDDKKIFELTKQVIEMAQKAPLLLKLIEQCQKIAKLVIDDAFDIMEILIQDACKTPDEISKVQKLMFRDIAYCMILNQIVYIRK